MENRENRFRRPNHPQVNPMSVEEMLRLEGETMAPTSVMQLVLIVDKSGSMTVQFDGMQSRFNVACSSAIELISNLKCGSLKDFVYLSIVCFSDDVEVVVDMMPISDIDVQALARRLSEIKPSGATALGRAVMKALELCDAGREQFRRMGAVYLQPLLGVFSDGLPALKDANGIARFSPNSMSQANHECTQRIRNAKLTVLPFYIGQENSSSGEGPRILARLAKAQADEDGQSAPVLTSVEDMRAAFRFLGMTATAIQKGQDPQSVVSRIEQVLGGNIHVSKHV